MSITRMTKVEIREFETLKQRIQKSSNDLNERDEAIADMMAFLGIIHNVPQAKRDWIEGRVDGIRLTV